MLKVQRQFISPGLFCVRCLMYIEFYFRGLFIKVVDTFINALRMGILPESQGYPDQARRHEITGYDVVYRTTHFRNVRWLFNKNHTYCNNVIGPLYLYIYMYMSFIL